MLHDTTAPPGEAVATPPIDTRSDGLGRAPGNARTPVVAGTSPPDRPAVGDPPGGHAHHRVRWRPRTARQSSCTPSACLRCSPCPRRITGGCTRSSPRACCAEPIMRRSSRPSPERSPRWPSSRWNRPRSATLVVVWGAAAASAARQGPVVRSGTPIRRRHVHRPRLGRGGNRSCVVATRRAAHHRTGARRRRHLHRRGGHVRTAMAETAAIDVLVPRVLARLHARRRRSASRPSGPSPPDSRGQWRPSRGSDDAGCPCCSMYERTPSSGSACRRSRSGTPMSGALGDRARHDVVTVFRRLAEIDKAKRPSHAAQPSDEPRDAIRAVRSIADGKSSR